VPEEYNNHLTVEYKNDEKREHENENRKFDLTKLKDIQGLVTCDHPNEFIYDFMGTSSILPGK
jgi:hypothetical protein